MKHVARTLILSLAFTLGLALTTSVVRADGPSAKVRSCELVFSFRSTALDRFVKENKTIEALNAEMKPLASGAEGLAAKLSLIKNAKHTIDLSYYIFKDDVAGEAVLAAIKEALQRGVKVRLLLDGFGAFHPTQSRFRDLVAYSREPNTPGELDIKLINPIGSIRKTLSKVLTLIKTGRSEFAPADANNRSHDKILLVDTGFETSWAVLGGRNIGDDYYGLRGKKLEIIDHEILMKGGAGKDAQADPLRQIQRHYDVMFGSRANLTLNPDVLISLLSRAHAVTKKIGASPSKPADLTAVREALEQMNSLDYWSQDFEQIRGAFITEVQNVMKNHRRTFARDTWLSSGLKTGLAESVFEMIKKAKSNVTIITPYALFNDTDIAALKTWLVENPEATFDLYTNSTLSTNQIIVTTMFNRLTLPKLQALKNDPLIGDRIHLYLFKGPSLLHAKAVVIDQEISLTTTTNLDPRSRIHNSEIGLWSNSRANCTALLTLAQNLKMNSIYVTTEQAPKFKGRGAMENLKLKTALVFGRVLETLRLDSLL